MDSNADNTSKDGRDNDDRDEDDDDEYEEGRDGSRLLEFMFGNVDGSGDLDIDYLDELSVRKSQTSGDAAEQADYDQKAEDAVDYEDIDEQYEGPEVQALTEEDYLLPKSDYVSTTVTAPLVASSSLFDDENYDEEEELPKELVHVDNNDQVQNTSVSGEVEYDLREKSTPEDGSGAIEVENLDPDVVELHKDDINILEEPSKAKNSTPLPVLCVEDGNVILRFSEIFAIHVPLKKAVKREQWFSVPKGINFISRSGCWRSASFIIGVEVAERFAYYGISHNYYCFFVLYSEKYKSMDVSEIVEEDEEAFLKGSLDGFPHMKHKHVFQDDFLTSNQDEIELPKSGIVNEDRMVISEDDDQKKDYCDDAMPLNGNTTLDLPLDQQDWEN
ncbi:hypothetical protein L1987_07827 [Smallanthus sonchifolius]|uniref:Uncharacterized protein n=1 Tax=Smallanthus sonchifolius TaxID=185202 RepID=A0ACB9JIF9_9ASTR|nr:hypothetical protein L1987_07827 [Smallanthus sonchifolius]